MIYQPGQQVEYNDMDYTIDDEGIYRWVRCTIIECGPIDNLYLIRRVNGYKHACSAAWLRPIPPLQELAEAAE